MHAAGDAPGSGRAGGAPAARGRAGSRAAVAALAGAALLLVLFGIRGLAPGGDALELPERIRDLLTLSISVLIESLPFVFLGVLLSIVVQIWLPATLFDRLLPRSRVLRRAVLSLLGVLLPVCECGNVPLARGLMVRGLSVSESITFLLAAPILNPVTIITTYQAFGWENGILAARIVGGFVIANLAGWVFDRHPRQHELLTPRFGASCSRPAAGGGRAGHDHAGHDHAGHDHGGREGVRSRLRRSALGFAAETSALLPALIVGSAIAGAIQVGVSREALVTLGSHPVYSVLALIALAFVIAICSNVDSFFILSFASTFMPGSIVAFLLFGAMMDVKMIALLRTTFTARTLALLAALVGLCCLCIGWGMNLVA
ncbi:permease [Leucobacter sp. CSA1]|uniref:Permease n=2 Tax=Leucobacter chromiisoli TaxID=2796471 RepID=A0A934Q6K9_9MICO|nr:permease [Leucobacter chromiisoli]